MKRIALISILFLFAWTSAVAEEFKAGVHYKVLDVAQPTVTGDKVEVREIFWYGCPHCFRFEPYVERWLRRKPDNAEFVRMPAVFRASWEPHARAFYVSEILGVFEQTHKPLFNAIHLENRKLGTDEALMDFFAKFGVDKKEFIKTYRSFAVETRIRRAKSMVSRYGIDGVPAVVVNGKYLVTNGMTGSAARTLQVINHLVEKESK